MQLKTSHILNILLLFHQDDVLKFERLQPRFNQLKERYPHIKINFVWMNTEFVDTKDETSIQQLGNIADLLILLCSASLLKSDFLNSRFLSDCLERHRAQQLGICPVLLSNCWWEDSFLKDLDILPMGGVAIFEANNPTNFFEQLMNDISVQVEATRYNKQQQAERLQEIWLQAGQYFEKISEDASMLQLALPLFKQCLTLNRAGMHPTTAQIEGKIAICQREINFRHYARTAQEAYDKDDWHTCLYNCKEALSLRNDAVILKVYKEVNNRLTKEALEQKMQPFLEQFDAAESHFLKLEWDMAKTHYVKAIELYDADFIAVSNDQIEYKIAICQREAALAACMQQAQAFKDVQDYEKAIKSLNNGLHKVHPPVIEFIEQMNALIDKTTHVIPFQNSKTHQWGYMHNHSKQVLIAAKYVAAYQFSERLAAVKKWNKWGYIDVEGHEIIPFEYSYVGPFNNGKAQVLIDNQLKYIDRLNNCYEADVLEIEVPANSTDAEIKALVEQLNHHQE